MNQTEKYTQHHLKRKLNDPIEKTRIFYSASTFSQSLIDSEVNHKRHFIKIPFINKGMEFIDLHSIFKDKSVISSFPNYFNNTETPIISYKYNKPIRSTILNFDKIVPDMDIDSNTPDS